MKISNKKIGLFAFTILIGAILILGFLLNLRLMKEPIGELKDEEINFKEFTSRVQKQYTSKFSFREGFLNLNGLFARVTGRKNYNNVSTLTNGMLTHSTTDKLDMSKLSNSINELNSHLTENGIEFLYVQLPMKVDINNSLIMTGNESYANANTNELLSKLDKDVEVMDLRNTLALDAEAIEKYFYRTDHHWNSYGAFVAYGQLLSYLNTRFPNESIDLSYANIDNWETTVYEDWFLGSHGKRVGKYFGGVDDLTVFKPAFQTAMSMYVTNHRRFTIGSFGDVVMDNKYLDNTDYFNENPYCVYIGGDYPLVHHFNKNAENDLKVLIIKDSYTLPVQAFLSTAIKEIDVLDPRHFKDCTIAEYVEASQPDIVIMMINPSQFSETKYQKFGISEAKEHAKQDTKNEVCSLDYLKLSSAKGQTHTYKIIKSKLAYNAKYTVSLDNINVLSGDAKGVTIALYNATTKKIASIYIFDLDFCKENTFEWSFITPNIDSGDLQLLIYCGPHSKTGGNTVEYTNIKLFKYE